MAVPFLTQFAAGCLLIIGIGPIRQCGWKYLRLIAFVSLGLIFLAALLWSREGAIEANADPTVAEAISGTAGQDSPARDADPRADNPPGEAQAGPRSPTGGAWSFKWAAILLGIGLVLVVGWLIVNAVQGERIRSHQRAWPLAAGLALLIVTILFLSGDSGSSRSWGTSRVSFRDAQSMLAADALPARAPVGLFATAVTCALGAGLLGAVTCAMLLGHRYLTDTDLPIAPLRRLGAIYLATVALRAAWVCIAAAPVWLGRFAPQGDVLLFWVALSSRVGIGIVATAVFAYMVWDCIRCRATQSATALFYLSMIFVFIGELAGQYLNRVHGLAL